MEYKARDRLLGVRESTTNEITHERHAREVGSRPAHAPFDDGRLLSRRPVARPGRAATKNPKVPVGTG